MLNTSVDLALRLNCKFTGFFCYKICVKVLVFVQQTAQSRQLAALFAKNVRPKTLVVHETVVGSLNKAVKS